MSKKILQLFCGVALALLIVEVFICKDYHDVQNEQKVADKEILIQDIKDAFSQLENNGLPYIDLSNVARFNWDKFYIFGPYTPERSIKSVLGIISPWGIGTTVDTSENKVFLVFTRQGNVVHSLDYFLDAGDFLSLIDQNSPKIDDIRYAVYPYGQARFALDESGKLIWIGTR